MYNLKYLEKINNIQDVFEIVLKNFTNKYSDSVQRKMALSILEFFNGGLVIDENDIEKTESGFSVSKKKYPKLNPNKR